ncbi:MAG TPA: hypothetical protein PLV92_06225, partial [Pirellulaceae bacterium]|nr:hypothetical protein [Pirellulaceae bacterium]
LSDEKVAEIEQFLAAHPEAPSSEAKAHFGDKYSYGELKMVIAHMQADGRRARIDEANSPPNTTSRADVASQGEASSQVEANL